MIFVKIYSVILGSFFVFLSIVFTSSSSNESLSVQNCTTTNKNALELYKQDSIKSVNKTDSILKVINYKCNKLVKQQDTLKRQQAELLNISKLK